MSSADSLLGLKVDSNPMGRDGAAPGYYIELAHAHLRFPGDFYTIYAEVKTTVILSTHHITIYMYNNITEVMLFTFDSPFLGPGVSISSRTVRNNLSLRQLRVVPVYWIEEL